MRDLVQFITRSLVENQDLVSVQEVETPQSIVLEVRVAHEDMGKIIGKQGRIAKAIRSVVKAASAKSAKPVYVEIIDQ